jgi:ribonucleoside-diphosphate reductase alpha chain
MEVFFNLTGEAMEKAAKILSDIVVYNKYAKYIPELKRRESFEELCNRNIKMHIDKFRGNPEVIAEINRVYRDYVKPRKILPSMRSMQFAGKPIELSPNRLYNCAGVNVDHPAVFSETMFLLLGGSGVGYSVQRHHVEQLPAIKKPTKSRRYLVADSIEGWADAVKVLIRSYFEGRPEPRFDFSDIRAKGTPLKTSGGKAPGPQPLHDCLHNVRSILVAKTDGDQLSTLEVHDIMCHIADAVLAGGIRRAAMIALFDLDDEDMLTCKFGNWWELNPQRGRANNSVVVLRHKITREIFDDIWKKVELSGSGEPGIYFSNDKDWTVNPCCEIALKSAQFCNLVEINISDVSTQEELEKRVKAATFLATIQASYTDFHYLRDVWKRNTEKDGLIGVSMTGIASGTYLNLDLGAATKVVLNTNQEVAAKIGINPAARTTCLKPAGTTSLVFGCASGVHAYHDQYYIRRMRLGKDESIYKYLAENHPGLIVDDLMNPKMGVLEVPIKAPEGAILRSESPIELLERIKRFSVEWVKSGHIKGENTHNVSATVSIKEDEWDKVGEWMWENRESYNGLSCLPEDGGTYVQAPFETCSEEVYDEMMKDLVEVDLTKVIEEDDNTDLAGEIACSGGSCEVK